MIENKISLGFYDIFNNLKNIPPSSRIFFFFEGDLKIQENKGVGQHVFKSFQFFFKERGGGLMF